MTEQIMLGIFVFIVGAMIGSFLNVCIVRMPQCKSIVYPSSHCVHCNHAIPWFDNIPLISYLLLKGHCRFCKKRISFRYFLVELITAVVFLCFYRYYGLTPVFFAYLIMVSGFIVATFVDFEHRIIPDEISIYGMYVGIFLSLLIPSLHTLTLSQLSLGRQIMWGLIAVCISGTYISEYLVKRNPFKGEDIDRSVSLFIVICFITDLVIKYAVPALKSGPRYSVAQYLISLDSSIIGLMIGGSVIYAMGLLGDILFRKESMGGGDIKLMAMIGAFMGWKYALLTFFIAPFLGAVYGIVEKIRTKDSAIAYGPFIVAGAIVSLFYGERIIQWILNGYGVYNINI